MINNELQTKIDRIVDNEILTCQSSLIDDLLKNGMFSYDDVQNMYIDNSDKIEELQDNQEGLQEQISDLEDEDNTKNDSKIEELQNQIDSIDNEIEELTEEQENPQEIFEWWIISNWLAKELKEQGEPILENDYGIWWGRTCTGQSIKMDGIIRKIAEN